MNQFLFSGRRIFLFFVFLASFAVPAIADVLFLTDGKILIGSIIGPVEGGVAYTVFDQRVVLGTGKISRTEKDLKTLAEVNVDIRLKDGSTIRGKVVDFDEEIGLFVDIGFGILTIPIPAVSEIVEEEVRVRYAGSSVQLRAGGGTYFPLFLSAGNFGPSWTSSVGGLVALPFARGLYTGLSFSVSGADYLLSDSVSYLFASVAPEIEFRFLGLSMRKDFLRFFTPYLSLKGGAAYISMTDPSLNPRTDGSLTGFFGLSTGLNLAVAKGFALRLNLFADCIVQETFPFLSTGISLFVCYDK